MCEAASNCLRPEIPYPTLYVFAIQYPGRGPAARPAWSGPWGRVWRAALYCVRVAQAERTDTECCNCVSMLQATESACTVHIVHGILTESVLQVRRLQAV